MWWKFLLGIAVAGLALVGTFHVISQPDIPRAVLEAKYAGPPSQFIVLKDGARAHYRERGDRDAPVLLLLHGSNASLFDWEPWSHALSDRFRVIAVDLPGHGLTGSTANEDYSEKAMTAFVKAFADKLKLKRFALAGSSMGGGIAARFSEIYPDRVNHLILVDALGMQDSFGSRVPLAFKLARLPIVSNLLLFMTPRSLAVEGLNDAIVRKAVLNDEMIDRYWDFARLAGTRQATVARFRLPPDDYVRNHAKAIKAPTLILWGEDDRLIPPAAAHAWAKAIPGSQLIIYPGVGHLPMVEVAAESADDARAFLER